MKLHCLTLLTDVKEDVMAEITAEGAAEATAATTAEATAEGVEPAGGNSGGRFRLLRFTNVASSRVMAPLARCTTTQEIAYAARNKS